jgi:hypothetical protein
MAKTKLNKEKRLELKRIVRDYIQREFNNDEEFIKLKKLLTTFQKCAQDEFDRVTNCTEDVKKFLKGVKLYGSCTVYSEHYTFYSPSIEILAPYSYNVSISFEYIYNNVTYITANDCNYDNTVSVRKLCEKYLESLATFNNFEEKMAELNKKYLQMQEKMSVIVDNCKYLEDVKEYLPIDEVNKYVDECLYNCNTFISVVTSEDINLVKDFINKNKK